MAPHVATRKTHQRFYEFSFDTPNRLLQQCLPISEVPNATLKAKLRSETILTFNPTDRRGTRRMEASAIACEAKALQHSFSNEAAGHGLRDAAIRCTEKVRRT